MLVGGWADGYTNAAGRTLLGLTQAGVPCRALIGPWSHGWPRVSEPGPQIGFLQECLAWWDYWLRGIDNGAMQTPLLRAWMQGYDRARGPPPETQRALDRRATSGRRRAVHERVHVPSDRRWRYATCGARARELAQSPSPLAGVGRRGLVPIRGDRPTSRPISAARMAYRCALTPRHCRSRWRSSGIRRRSSSWPSIARWASSRCGCAMWRRMGPSLLVARGLLNLTHRNSDVDLAPMPVGEPTVLRVRLDMMGTRLPPGTESAWP